jgi:hypothetical protein
VINVPKPIYILPFFYIFVVLYTIAGTSFFGFATEVPFQLYDKISQDFLIKAILSITIAAISFTFGAMIGSFGKYRNHIAFLDTINQKIMSIKSLYIILIYLSVLLFLHLGYSPSLIYYKEGYIVGDKGIAIFRIAYSILLPFSILLLPMLRTCVLRWFLLIAVLLLVLGTSSRMIILIPSFYYLGHVIKSKKISLISFFICITIMMFLLNAVVNFRDNQFQGLIPNFVNIISGNFKFDLLNYSLNYLFSFSVFASAYTIQNFSFDIKSFFYSVSPLPSSCIDVSYMLTTQKFNEYSPFPAIAYLSLGGIKYLFFYYFISGLVWAYILKKIELKNLYIYFFIAILLIVFTFLSTQYNLRGATRLTYYAIVIFGISKVKGILPKKKVLKLTEYKSNTAK